MIRFTSITLTAVATAGAVLSLSVYAHENTGPVPVFANSHAPIGIMVQSPHCH